MSIYSEKEASSSSSSSKFKSIVTDDLLLEILIRLPHRLFIIQCSTVCKRWFSLLSDPQFIRQFNQFHNQLIDYPFTILFTLLVPTDIGMLELFSKESNIIHGVSRTKSGNYLNFFSPMSVPIKATFFDLLLVTPRDFEYCVFNPLTKQCVFLPQAPYKGNYEIFGFLGPHPNNNNNNNNSQFFSYKILLIFNILNNINEFVIDAAIFCSDTRVWSRSTLSCPRTWGPAYVVWDSHCVASNGILYSQLLDLYHELRGFAAFDLYSSTSSRTDDDDDDDPIQFRLLPLPIDFAPGWQASLDHVCFGDVRGRLRLSQLLEIKSTEEWEGEQEWEFVLKVWELNNNNNNNADEEWLLVHKIRLRTNKTDKMFVAAFHPNNEDVIFMFFNYDLFEYKVGEGKYKKIGQSLRDNIKNTLTKHFRKFTLVHPPWPTLIPTLPSV